MSWVRWLGETGQPKPENVTGRLVQRLIHPSAPSSEQDA